MSTQVDIYDGPLPSPGRWEVDRAGAMLCFDGVVRPLEDGQPIAGLHYQTYDPMAQRELQRLADQTLEQFDLLAIRVEHSRGFVPSGACSFRLRVASAHRQEALRAMDWFIDEMKAHVPIWKRPAWAEASDDIAHPPTDVAR